MNILLSLFYLYIMFTILIFIGILTLDLVNYLYRDKDLLNWNPDKYKIHSYNPRTLVMVPCKGRDIDLTKNLLSLKKQDYKNYDLIAIIDNYNDSALKSIRRAGLSYILSDKHFNGCSGKVASLLTAMTKMKEYTVYAVADSDVMFDKRWLGMLIKPLKIRNVGVSTTYPYFIPVKGIWSEIKMVWNFVGNGLMESESTRFVWGGSMAFKKSLIDKRFIKMMKGAISDDIEVTKACKRNRLKICYVNKEIIHTKIDENLRSFYEWANRQTALSIYGNRKLLLYGMAIYSVDIILLLSGVLLSIFYNPIFIFLLLPTIVGIIKTYTRAKKKYPSLFLIYIAVLFIYVSNLIIGGRMKSIKWRGRRYNLYVK